MNQLKTESLCEKCPNTDFFSGPYFLIFGPEKTPYFNTFHAANQTVNGHCYSSHRNVTHCKLAFSYIVSAHRALIRVLSVIWAIFM